MRAACPRRWFQWSLKSLFLLTLVAAAFFAGYVLATRQAEEERRRAELEAQQAAEAARLEAQAARLEAAAQQSQSAAVAQAMRWLARQQSQEWGSTSSPRSE